MKPLTKGTSYSIPMRPLTGVHSRPTLKAMISTRPHQNTGMLLPTVAVAITNWSNHEPRFSAAAMPKGRPSSSASTSALPASSTVAGKSTLNSSATGSRVTRLWPRSPCASWPR